MKERHSKNLNQLNSRFTVNPYQIPKPLPILMVLQRPNKLLFRDY
jgi:hypothetical protein